MCDSVQSKMIIVVVNLIKKYVYTVTAKICMYQYKTDESERVEKEKMKVTKWE